MFGWMQLTGHVEIILRMLPELYPIVYRDLSSQEYKNFVGGNYTVLKKVFEAFEGNGAVFST